MKTLLYLHGLGSNAASRKFTSLQQAFGDRYQLHCPEWTTTTVITDFLNNLFNYYEHEKSILIIGSSTGANFAYQLTQKLRRKGVSVELILVNPLLSLSQRISLREFPAQLATYLQDIVEVENCKLILSRQD
jgi:predicted esterase YcpF (UPF0227 family)